VDFTKVSSGSPLGNLPVDPTNQTSTGLYYAYVVQGDPWEMTCMFESQRYIPRAINDGDAYPGVYSVGSTHDITPGIRDYGLVGQWNFDEGAGSTAYDSSGFAYNGTWHGTQAGTSGYYSTGKVGQWAGYFNGSNDYVDVKDSSSSLNLNNFTLGGWIYMTRLPSQSSNGTILGKRYSAQAWSLAIAGNTPYALFNVFGAKTHSLTGTTTPLSLDSWYFIVGTFNASSQDLYVNGTLIASTAFNSDTVSPSTYDVGIGSLYGNSTNFLFPGLIDDVRIYDRALSASEIQAIYNAEK